MISANKAFKEQNKKVNYADIILRDGTVLNLEPSDFILSGFSMTDETTTGKFGIGNTVGKTMSLSIANHTNKFSNYDFYKSIIYMYVSVTLEDGTILKERKGKYYVMNPTSPGDVISLSGVDSMSLFDKPYKATTVYPATLHKILSDCCLDCGINIGFKQFDNYDFIVQNKPKDCTYRHVVSWAAQIAGYNARISNNDYLELVWYEKLKEDPDILNGGELYNTKFEDTYDGGDFNTYSNTVLWDGGNFTDPIPENVTRIKSIKVSTDNVFVTGVTVKNGGTEVLAGEEGYCISVLDNELAIGKESEIAQYLGERLIGLTFRPLTCQIANNPLIEPFDIVYVYDRKGNSYFTFINSVNYSIGGFTTIACKAEDPIRNESSYVSKEAQAVVKARKEAKEELSNYDKAVQNMNMLAANAMGLFREYEEKTDGGIVYYMSNRPIVKNETGICEFALNSVVYKMTGDGFFVSEDGGKSFTGGFDANMNVVVNILSAIGITFDWAHGGTITLGGIDNKNGILTVLNEKGIEVGRWDNTGITLPPGTTISWTQVEDKEGVANKTDIPTDNKELKNGAGYTTRIDVNGIITGTVTAQFVDSLKIKAGSVDAENITGTIISGKKFSGGSIEIGSKFSVDSSGNVIANSFESNNAKITGGSISINTNTHDTNVITLNNSLYSLSLTPAGIGVKYSATEASLTYNGLSFSSKANILATNLFIDSISAHDDYEIKVQDPLHIYANTTFEIGYTHTFKGTVEMSGNVNLTGLSGRLTLSGNATIAGSGKLLGFFGNSGTTKRAVSTITSTSGATTSSNASKINEIINALKAYNLI